MPDFLKAAKNGDVRALEALMNKSFGSQGVVVHIASVGSTLNVTLKTPSEPGPDKKLASRVKAGLSKISPKGFDKVFVSAKIMKSDQMIWYSQWGLESSEKNYQVTPSQAPDKQKRASDFEMEVNREGPRKWVVLSLSGVIAVMGFGVWWLVRSEALKVSRTSSSPSPITASPAPQKPEEPAATSSEIQVFSKLIALIDPEQTAITQIQQDNDTELLYLTVGQGFIANNKINQGDLAIRLRDAWNKICDCYGQLIFQSAGGQQLIHIAALGEPKFKQN